MNKEPMTLQQIAEAEGVSHQRIAEILASALKKFKKALADRGIKIQDLL
jgi:DNA-directed RNA polymerase sigma subunit (sigma70/sigma32)